MPKAKPELTVYKNAIEVKMNNRRLTISNVGNDKNSIVFKALTKHTGKEAGIYSKLSENEKIKFSKIGLSDDAIIVLYHALGEYLNNKIMESLKDKK